MVQLPATAAIEYVAAKLLAGGIFVRAQRAIIQVSDGLSNVSVW